MRKTLQELEEQIEQIANEEDFLYEKTRKTIQSLYQRRCKLIMQRQAILARIAIQ